jgi:dTDP-4-dehydrorhamnose reductase
MSLRILITGSTGQVGWQLQRTLAALGDVTARSRSELNFENPEAVAKFVRQMSPDIVVNAAAYTAVDRAESDADVAHTVNATTPGRIAEELSRSGGLLVHYSTDYVFPGDKSVAYNEQDATGPINVYGRTKLEGEQAIAASGCAQVILRTSWVFDIRGKNFLRTILRLAREEQELSIVDDQYGSPTWARVIAEATAQIVGQYVIARMASGWKDVGIYHLTASGKTSWAGFAEEILRQYESLAEWAADTGEWGAPLVAKRINRITTDQYPTLARRPRTSVLSNAKLHETFGLRLPDWRDQLKLALQDAVR